MDDVQLISDTYNRCWERSRGRQNSWIDDRLHPLARRFYIVVNATERCLTGGVPSLLEESRFALTETAEAYESFGFCRHAQVLRELAALVDEGRLSRRRRERSQQLNRIAISPADAERLNTAFPMTDGDEREVWRVLARFIRGHADAFPEPANGL